MSEEDTWSIPCHAALLRDKPTLLACDSETEGLRWVDKAFGVSFAWEADGELRSGYIDIRYHPELWTEVKAWIKDDKPELIFHNAKFDQLKLGLFSNDYHDTCLMVWILDENYPKSLKVLAEKVLGVTTDEATVLKETRKKLGLTVNDGYHMLPLDVVAPYAIQDSIYTYQLYLRLAVAIAKEPDLEEVYKVERQLSLCVAGMEMRGIGVDTEYLKRRIIELGDEILTLEREIQGIVGKPLGDGKKKERVLVGKYKNGNPKYQMKPLVEFNPNSPAQIQEFFNSVGIKLSGTSEDLLGAIPHRLATVLLEIRSKKKIRNTYLVPLLEQTVDGVAHPNLNIMGTRTKRFSSSGASDG